MALIKKENYFPFITLLITIISVNDWNRIPIGNTYVEWLILFLAFSFLYKYIRKHNLFWTNGYKILAIYIVYVIIQTIRGVFVADNYWEYKALVAGSSALLMPAFIYYFITPNNYVQTFVYWYRYAIKLFVIFFAWTLQLGAYNFYLSPVLLFGCFLPLIKRRWRIVMIFLLTLMLFVDLGARSQVIKAFMCFIISALIIFTKYTKDIFIKIAHWICYSAAIILLILGISGKYNIFAEIEEGDKIHSSSTTENLNADTRSALYVEVINSAINNDYIIWGRSPARGNDSDAFGALLGKELRTGKYERHSNEIGGTNVFTWIGLIGVFLNLIIYLRGSYLAVYRSRNVYIKLIGFYIAFRWMYSWVEDFNRFDIMNLTLWAMIAMGYSKEFRNMSDIEFKNWVRSVFPKRIL